jgi:hypothetical protein
MRSRESSILPLSIPGIFHLISPVLLWSPNPFNTTVAEKAYAMCVHVAWSSCPTISIAFVVSHLENYISVHGPLFVVICGWSFLRKIPPRAQLSPFIHTVFVFFFTHLLALLLHTGFVCYCPDRGNLSTTKNENYKGPYCDSK